MILIIVSAFATVLLVFWVFLLLKTEQEDFLDAAYNKILSNREQIEKLKKKDLERAEQLDTYSGISHRFMRLLLGGSSGKKIKKLEKTNEAIQSGVVRHVNVTALPGYVLQRKFAAIAHGTLYRKLYSDCAELFGRKHAEQKTKHILAQLLSYPFVGIAAALLFGVILACARDWKTGLIVMLIGTLLVCVLVYAIYDEVKDQLNKRRAAISRQFPNVVSKLALLVTSGMIMERAWIETAQSQNTVLYQEMQRTARELANLMEPAEAYTGFLNRCNTKETTKLASAILQNQSKGNAEIGLLLKSMAHEAWQERRHNAKRDSEKANSKLMIPTMLLFMAILVMILVPVALSFQGL